MLLSLLLLPLVAGNWALDHELQSPSPWLAEENSLSRQGMYEFEHGLWPRMIEQKPRKEEFQEVSKTSSASQSSSKPRSGDSPPVSDRASSSRTSSSKVPESKVQDSKSSFEPKNTSSGSQGSSSLATFKNPLLKSSTHSSSFASQPPLSKPRSSISNIKPQVNEAKVSRTGPSLSRSRFQNEDMLEERKKSKPYRMQALTKPHKNHEPLGASMPWSSVDPSSIKPTAKIAAQALHKKLGLDEYPKGDTAYTPESIAKAQKWFDQSKDRVTVAKTRASTNQKYQPIGVDKAKTEAQRRRVKSDEATKKLSSIDAKDVDTMNINHAINAKVAGKLDRDAGLKYAEQHSKAATKASNDNRWNDVARHEQASARASTRTNLRYQAMKDTKNDLYHRGRIDSDKKSGRNDLGDLQKKQNKARISKGEHIIADHWYQQAREAFSGSDSEEDTPAASKSS